MTSVAAAESMSSVLAPPSSLFPLPLSPIELFLFLDSRPEFPTLIDFELELAGALDRAAMESAIAFAVARNPLFVCRVAPDGRGDWHWVAGDCQPAVYWLGPDEPLDDKFGTYLDLTTTSGLRIWIRRGEDRAHVFLQFHHACCDGMGGFAFVEDLLAGYSAAAPSGPVVEARPLEPARLRGRGEVGLIKRNFFWHLFDLAVEVLASTQFFWRSPQPLVPSRARTSGAAPRGDLRFITATCSPQVTSGVRQAAKLSGVTTNDLLLRDLFLVLRRWNREQGESSDRGRLRILMPQNLREADDARMPAANGMSFAFLTRRARDCDDPGKLLQSIRVETEALKRWRLSLYFLGCLILLRRWGLLGWVLGRPACFSTAVLTNLSYPLRRFAAAFPATTDGLAAGNVVLQRFTASPPLRPQTHAGFGIMNAEHTITISLRSDPASLSPDDARALLEMYVSQLAATADGATGQHFKSTPAA